jgi:beta-aspartyl-peptidase (threonine type)
MQGKDLKAGSVSGITTVKNPISAARMVMDSSEFVMLSGKGAEQFAALKKLEIVDPSYFFTQVSWDELVSVKQKAKETIPEKPKVKNEKYGTVGAVALDKHGNISAGTSTGGRTNKRWGRIGDSPIIGASTYADNRYCGVSSTGWGEFFIRNCVAHSVISMMEFKNVTVNEAAEFVMFDKMKGIEGGIIALDPKGKVSIAFSTPVMNRGYITMDGEPQVFIYK